MMMGSQIWNGLAFCVDLFAEENNYIGQILKKNWRGNFQVSWQSR